MLRWSLALLVFPVLVYLHLRIAPYTKVEESFNIQAVHDLLTYGIPSNDAEERLKAQYDHMTFPGAVPRTFIGALLLAGPSALFTWLTGAIDRQHVVRGVLGLFNAASLITYAIGVRKAFGTTAGWWYVALQGSQFHVIYYASRTLPNTFAFGISTFALRLLLPDPASADHRLKRVRLAVYLLTLTTVIFRSELALLLASQSLYLFFASSDNGLQSQISLVRSALLPAGVLGAFIGLALSIPIDTFFWASRTPLWPELSAFLSNVFPSDPSLGASAWGTNPWHWYLTSALPRLLLNPLSLPLLAYNFAQPATRRVSIPLLLPSISYVVLYSFLAHKETRFLFPVVPPLSAATAIAASHITHRRHRSTIYRFCHYALVLSTLASYLLAHAVLLPLSALSYPGAHALHALHALHAHVSSSASVQVSPYPSVIAVHLDNLALQTGVTRFLQMPLPVKLQARGSMSSSPSNVSSTYWIYDKSDDSAQLLDPLFWDKFDYAVMEDPGLAIGAWEVVGKVYGLGKVRVLRPDEERGSTQRDKGPAGVVGQVYGGILAEGYCLLKDMAREGWGLRWLLGRRSSWTAGWWVDVGLVEKLFVLRRTGGLAELAGGRSRVTVYRVR